MIKELRQRIEEKKREIGAAVLAHSYQSREIIEAADIVGDSYALAERSAKIESDIIILAGVKFMAETVKILSPSKRVFLANEEAGCPMAEQLDAELLAALKAKEPDRKVIAYVNTTAELKRLSDVCVTSSSAVKIVRNMVNRGEGDKFLFIPDCNLGDYVRRQVPEADIKLIQGGCPVHASATLKELTEAKERHSGALVLIHPECLPKLVEAADFVGSTSEIMEYAKKSSAKRFIIGTEMSIAEHLKYECPDKEFYLLSKKILCPNMRMTTLPDVLETMENLPIKKEIILSGEEIKSARKCLDKMIELNN